MKEDPSSFEIDPDLQEIALKILPVTCSRPRVSKYLGSDIYIKKYVAGNCLKSMVNIGKHEPLTDGFVHFQHLKICKDTREKRPHEHRVLLRRGRHTEARTSLWTQVILM
jgi:hypothetical protein